MVCRRNCKPMHAPRERQRGPICAAIRGLENSAACWTIGPGVKCVWVCRIHSHRANVQVRYEIGGGPPWRTTTDFIADLNIGTMAMDPTNPNTLYAGTDGPTGGTVFKTTNGGTDWTALPFSGGVHRLAISPTNHNVLLVA